MFEFDISDIEITKALEKELKEYKDGAYVKTGALDGATHSKPHFTRFPVKDKDGNITPSEKEYIPKEMPSIPQILLWQEYGTKTAPRRAALALAFENNKDKWVEILVKSLRMGKSLNDSFNIVGNKMKVDLIRTIQAGIAPELSEFTLQMRKVNNMPSKIPLRASGELLKSLEYEVTNKSDT